MPISWWTLSPERAAKLDREATAFEASLGPVPVSPLVASFPAGETLVSTCMVDGRLIVCTSRGVYMLVNGQLFAVPLAYELAE